MLPVFQLDDSCILRGKETCLGLAVRSNDSRDVHVLSSHPNGLKLISRDNNLTQVQLRAMAVNDEKVIRLTEAYANEKPFQPDVNTNRQFNSYKSLHPEIQ